MADPTLDDINRSRLDGIVQQAQKNGETEDTIQAIVNDYKSKYGTKSTFKQRDAAQGAKGSSSPDYVNLPDEEPAQGLFRSTMGQPLANAAPTLVSMAAPEGGVLSTGAGIAIKNLLQRVLPSSFGQPSDTPVSDAGKDLLFNNVIPGAAGKLADPEAAKIGFMASKPIRSTSPSIQAAMEADRIGTNAVQANDFIHAQVPGSVGMDSMNNLMSKGLSSNGTLDATSILNEMKYNPDKYKMLNPDVKNNLTNFLTTVQAQKPLAKVGADNLLRYSRNRLILALPSMAAGGIPGYAATASTLVLGEAAIKQALSNPETTKLLMQAIKTPSAAPEAGMITKTLLNGLKGTSLIMRNSDDKDITTTVGPDGQPQYQK